MRSFVAIVSVALITACSSARPSVARISASPSNPTTAGTSTVAVQPVPTTATPKARMVARTGIRKVLTIIEENHSLAEMRSGMPYLYGLAKRYGYATDYRAIRHPSLPNYLAIAGGSTFGVTDDENPAAHRLHGPSVFGQTISAGGSARLYAEALPRPCSTTGTAVFAVRHAPWAYFQDERKSCLAGEVASGTPSAGRLRSDILHGGLPTTGMLIPDLVHDAHDGSLGQADRWLKGWLPVIMAGPDFASGRLAIVVTADEDDYTKANTVLTVVIARGMTRHVVTTPLTHYSLTRFYDEVAGAKPLRSAATSTSLGAAFRLTVR
jgi:hypothetical protein